MAFYTAGLMSGHVPKIDSAAATLSGLLCIGSIGGLALQKTAPLDRPVSLFVVDLQRDLTSVVCVYPFAW